MSTGTAVVAALALALGASWIAVRAYDTPELTLWLRLAAPGVLFIVMNGFRSGALAGLESYPALARTGVISGSSTSCWESLEPMPPVMALS